MARLIEELRKLPGIGSKNAQRLAFHILRSNGEDAEALANAVREVKAQLQLCAPSATTSRTSIPACTARVQRETSGWFAWWRSRRISPRSKRRAATTASIMCCTERCRRCMELVRNICARAVWWTRVSRGDVDEVILATSPTVEGEATAAYLAEMLRGGNVVISRIATGVPAGSDIEYADEVTMSRAMEGRRERSTES